MREFWMHRKHENQTFSEPPQIRLYRKIANHNRLGADQRALVWQGPAFALSPFDYGKYIVLLSRFISECAIYRSAIRCGKTSISVISSLFMDMVGRFKCEYCSW
jgi:hypothetical protein